MADTALAALRQDLVVARRMLRVKQRLVNILAKLPDDAARRRVILAVAVLYGYDPVRNRWEQP